MSVASCSSFRRCSVVIVLAMCALVLAAHGAPATAASQKPPTKEKPPAGKEPAPANPNPPQGQPQGPQLPPPRPVTREPAIAIMGLVDVGYTLFSAKDSFDAVYGTSGGFIWGGGVRVAHRSGIFGELTASRFAASGQRVFVNDGTVFPLGIASDLTIVPIDITGGWRFVPRPRLAAPTPPRPPTTPPPGPPGRPPARAPTPAPRRARQLRVIPYVGGGIGFVRLTEEGAFSTGTDNVSETHTSYHVKGGLDFSIQRWLAAGVTGGVRWVPDGLAGSGIAQEFGETALDHFFFAARVTIGR
jgi:hypothetical protein